MHSPSCIDTLVKNVTMTEWSRHIDVDTDKGETMNKKIFHKMHACLILKRL